MSPIHGSKVWVARDEQRSAILSSEVGGLLRLIRAAHGGPIPRIPFTGGYGAGIVRVPTAFVHGRRDPFFSRASVQATGRFVRGRLRVVALDAGHWLPEQQPQRIAEVVGTLAGEAARAPG